MYSERVPTAPIPGYGGAYTDRIHATTGAIMASSVVPHAPATLAEELGVETEAGWLPSAGEGWQIAVVRRDTVVLEYTIPPNRDTHSLRSADLHLIFGVLWESGFWGGL